MKRVALLALCAVIGMGTGAIAARADDPVLRFRGAGTTREALDAMQLKPFDQSLWSNLSDWNGGAPKNEDLTGKPVMIVTWASWYPVSQGAMRSAEAVYEKYKDKGLVVVGVHNPVKPEGAAENAKTLGVTFPFAVDKDGKFRAALKADQDPNIYFIDRSGNMRFAQVDKASMEEAAAHLVKETAEQAKEYPLTLQRQRSDAEKAKWLTKDPSGLRPGEEVTVSFEEPDEETYKKTRWPYMIGKTETDPIFDKIRNDPPTIKNWPEEDWTPAHPSKAGKIIVIYYFDPKEVDMLNAIPVMNRLNDDLRKDVLVVGSLFKVGQGSFAGNNGGGGPDQNDEKLKERNKELVGTILRTRSVNHYLTPVTVKIDNLDLGGGGGAMLPRFSNLREETGFAVVLSTDMKVRWIGSPFDQDLRIALKKLIEVDPAVKARHKAEAKKTGQK